MKKILNYPFILVEKIENYPTSFLFWSISFLSIIFSRVLVENWLSGMVNNSGDYFFHHVYYTFVFFLLVYLIFLGLVYRFLKVPIAKASNVLLFGYLLIITPPIFDYLILGDKFYLSFYGIYGLEEMIKRFLTFFGDSPDFGVTYGVRIEIALTVFLIFFYGYAKTKRWIMSLSLALLAYTILFVLGTFPSWIAIIIKGFPAGFLNVDEIQIVQMFLSPADIFSRSVGSFTNALSVKLSMIYSLLLTAVILAGSYFHHKEKFISFLGNIRPVQIIYHIGLFVIGMGLGIKFTDVFWNVDFFNILGFLNLALAIIFAWLASVVANDFGDERIDAITNKSRPLSQKTFSKGQYAAIGVLLFIFSLLLSAAINPKVAMILAAYQALAWLYSMHPFRLKRIPLVASFLSAITTILVLFSGFMVATTDQNIIDIPTQLIWLLIFSFTLSLPIKDLKDIEGDKKYGVFTIPVIFGEYWGKIIIGSGIFISYISSVFVLREFRLVFWAILLGGISFWIVVLSGKNKRITNRNVIWWAIALVAIYAGIIFRYI